MADSNNSSAGERSGGLSQLDSLLRDAVSINIPGGLFMPLK